MCSVEKAAVASKRRAFLQPGMKKRAAFAHVPSADRFILLRHLGTCTPDIGCLRAWPTHCICALGKENDSKEWTNKICGCLKMLFFGNVPKFCFLFYFGVFFLVYPCPIFSASCFWHTLRCVLLIYLHTCPYPSHPMLTQTFLFYFLHSLPRRLIPPSPHMLPQDGPRLAMRPPPFYNFPC